MVGYLTTGGLDDPFLPKLEQEIHQATEINIAVAFIKHSGLELIFEALVDAVTHRGARLRVLTSDYLDVTDPRALRSLMLLKERGADVRVFEAGQYSFHLKAYIFLRTEDGAVVHGSAFVGSSNISRKALTDGLEWNYRVARSDETDRQAVERFREVREQFEQLFATHRAVPLEYDWIEAYERRRQPPAQAVAPGSDDREPLPAVPNEVQQEALAALPETRETGYRRGLVVMATGLGKTFLAAFDAKQIRATRVLFVAHREEILLQAEETFQRVLPHKRVGYYSGKQKDGDVELLFASIQTLGRDEHLEQFAADHFDYIVVDEFHHASAPTYRRLLQHFNPPFLLGLTATPDRTDQSDILSFCDDNLVFHYDLFGAIDGDWLCPFTYYGIYDEAVDYQEIPWRSGRFDPEVLSNKLATLGRARHALREWREKRQQRTLAFCCSRKHADFMAEQFRREGVRAASVHGASTLNRSEALEQLRAGDLDVIFSVDLFNEGTDLPGIDTVMMLRPTDSKVLFLQQLGRGLRQHEGKERLVVLDFIGNHKGFLNKPQALLGAGATQRELAELGRRLERGEVELPAGCFVNYDLRIIEFLKQLDTRGFENEYEALKASLGRRPTAAEMYRAGVSMSRLRQQHGPWWQFVASQGDLEPPEQACLQQHNGFLQEVETTAMTKSFKMVLLEALLELDGLTRPPTVEALAARSLEVFRRRRPLNPDIHENLRDTDNVDPASWLKYWRDNPVNAWVGGNRGENAQAWFHVRDGRFEPQFHVDDTQLETLTAMIQELVDYRLAAYQTRLQQTEAPKADVLPFPDRNERTELPYFPNIRIACGHFKSGRADAEEYRALGPEYGRLDAGRHFIARASGNSMNGGKQPIRDGDYLLLERVTPGSAGSITGGTMAIERVDESGDAEYLLRIVTKTVDDRYILKATNPDYADLEADEGMRTFARLKAKIDPLDMAVGESFMREDIPALFGHEFNPGNWNSGHIVLQNPHAHILLVTLNKQGKDANHRYHDYFIDEHTFHWQSQNNTTPQSKRGREIIEHEQRGIPVHLFVRDARLSGGKAAPFTYYGRMRYLRHQGSGPMSVAWEMVG
ncbi:DUF3427 domain-containing protein [Arhodomonas sp. SL1]|uniref:DUF3427 domain-containing protein n=1 Tax=Arhodomonas sp. SL1 TaxID=3425691 RepID=UPI003F8804AE